MEDYINFMFNSNSIFDKTDKEESKKCMLSKPKAENKNDEEWIRDNLARILDDEMDYKQNKKKQAHASHNQSKLLHQFDTVDREAKQESYSLLNQAFDSIGFGQEENTPSLQFPDGQNPQQTTSYPKFYWKSNPTPNFNQGNYIPEYNSKPNTTYNYYSQHYSPFDQFDEMAFPPQNSSPFNSPDNYNRVYNEPYYAHSEGGIQFPDSDPMYNANQGIFSAFDVQEQMSPFANLDAGAQGCINFPSTSNMVSTATTSNNMQQFAAYPQCDFPQASRISCPVKLQSKTKLECKQKFKSSDACKSTFMKALETRLDEFSDDVVIAEILGKGKLPEVVRNQKGSRFIQEAYYTTTEEEKDQIFKEIKECWRDLMLDKFGNYVIQKIFEHGPESQKEYFAQQLRGSMMSMSIDDHGCRVIQKLLENLKSDTRNELVMEMHGNVEKLIYNRNGNHVIQKCLEYVPEKHLDFIIEEITENVYAFCKHKYGCRVVGKLIEFCKSEEVDKIVEEVLPYVNELTFDASGNYVAQSIIMHGKTAHKKYIISMFKKDLLKYSTQKYASNVIECWFKYWSNAQRKEIVKELFKSTKTSACPLEKMLKDKFGNYVIQKMLEKLDAADREAMVGKVLELTKNKKQVNNSSKHVLKIIKDKYL